MFKKVISIILISLGVVAYPAAASSPAALKLPPQASQVTTNVFYLGRAYDAATNLTVEGYAIVHKDNKARSKQSAKPNKGSGSKCYSFIATGAKWKVVENWLMNPANPDGLDGNTLFNLVTGGISKWELAADGKDILGNGSQTGTDLSVSYGTLNNQNEVYFGSLDSGTIAVTIVWGTFSGPTFARQIVEWDQVYNTSYSWSAEAEGVIGKMDFDNIATHELGHAFGLADLYNASCSTQTMYGYADWAEIDKRTLESGDIAGVKELYK